jgi:hypothetical protein
VIDVEAIKHDLARDGYVDAEYVLALTAEVERLRTRLRIVADAIEDAANTARVFAEEE